MADDDCTDGLTLLRYADLALYAAKNERKGSLKRFVAEMDVAAQDKARLESDLREASRKGELAVHYQPLIDLATGEVTAHEALFRWNHPGRGLLYPDTSTPPAAKPRAGRNTSAWR